MTLRAAIYARQSVKEDEGIKQQIAVCKSRIDAEEWQLVGEAHQDNFVSATKHRDETTAWAAMLNEISAGNIDVIVSVSVDRLLRRVTDVMEVTEPQRKVRIVTCRDGIDTASSMGKTMLTVITALAENEIDTKNARMKPYADARHLAGHPTAGLVPYGYEWIPKLKRDEKGTRYAVVETEASVVRFMFAEVLQHSSVAALCRELNNRGIFTRRGAKWGTSTVRRMLLSPFYAALLPDRTDKETHYRAQDVSLSKARPGLWPRIVTENEVRAARNLLMDPTRLTHDGNTSRKWLLPGIATCGKCGSSIRSAVTKESNRGYAGQCGHFQRRADVIDQYVEDAVITVLSTPGTLIRLPDDDVDVPALKVRKAALENKLHEAYEMWECDELDRAGYARAQARFDSEIELITSQLSAAFKRDPLSDVVSVTDLRSVWADLTTARKQTIIRTLLERIAIHPVGKGKRIKSVEAVSGTVVLTWRNTLKRYSFNMPLEEQSGTVERTKFTEAQAADIAMALNAA